MQNLVLNAGSGLVVGSDHHMAGFLQGVAGGFRG